METISRLVHLGDSSDFEAAVIDSEVPVLADFYADWCGPCQMVSPLLERLVDVVEVPVRIVKIDVDAMPGLVGRFNIMGIPTLLMFKGGEVVDRKVGVPTLNQLLEMVESTSSLAK